MRLYKQSRKAAGITQAELGSRLGISRSMVGRIETGKEWKWLSQIKYIQFFLVACGYDFTLGVNRVAYTDKEIRELMLSRGIVKPGYWEAKANHVKGAKEPVQEAEK